MIDPDRLVVGWAYRIRSRNLRIGVYRGQGVFTGIRTKFGERYLASELLNDPPGQGTVRAVTDQVAQVPDGMPLTEERNQQLIDWLEPFESVEDSYELRDKPDNNEGRGVIRI
jgi:hypothetical protein